MLLKIWQSRILREGEGAGGGGGGGETVTTGTTTASPSAIAAASDKPVVAPGDQTIVDALKGIGITDESVLNSPHFSKVKTLKDLPKAFVDQAEFVGRKGLVLPAKGPGESPEEWGEVWTALGRPENAEGYEIPNQEGGEGENAPFREEVLGFIRSTAFELGLSKQQGEALADRYRKFAAKMLAESVGEVEQKQAEGITALKAELGTAFDSRMAEAKQHLKEFGDLEYAEAMGWTKDPKFIKYVMNSAAPLRHERLWGKPQGIEMQLTPEEAKVEIHKMETDRATRAILRDPKHEKYQETTNKRAEYYKMAYPPKQA